MTVDTGRVDFCVLGTMPLIHNRPSQKVLQGLLCPAPKKTAVEKRNSFKHDPLEEYRESPYKSRNTKSPTLIEHLSSAFKCAMKSAALDLPGVTKAAIGRSVWVEGERVAIYGVPEMSMMVVRSADMNRTPDVRTRAIMPEWACRITVSYVRPQLTEQAVCNLLAAAGLTRGIGDGRNEKGWGTFGQFELVEEKDPRYVHLMKHAGRKAQKAALAEPGFYDDETEALYQWFLEEVERRKTIQPLKPKKAPKAKSKTNGASAEA